MRRAGRSLALAMALGLGVAAPARGQSGLATEGVLSLLVPIGARTVGAGQTMAAVEHGAESLWGNPAGISRATQREVGFHFSKTVVANGTTLGLVMPAGKAGVFGVGAQMYDYGVQDNTDLQTGETVGQILPRDVVLAATYAATLGSQFRAGISYKIVQQRVDCSGPCGLGGIRPYQVSTNAVDVGMQYQSVRRDSLGLGIVLRNAGLKLQVNDSPQSDPLPMRLHIGVGARVPSVAERLRDAELRWSAELVTRSSFQQPAIHAGAELALQKQFFLRAGYTSETGEVTGATVGLGFARGRIGFDFARVFSGPSADAGEPPTFVTFRVQW